MSVPEHSSGAARQVAPDTVEQVTRLLTGIRITPFQSDEIVAAARRAMDGNWYNRAASCETTATGEARLAPSEMKKIRDWTEKMAGFDVARNVGRLLDALTGESSAPKVEYAACVCICGNIHPLGWLASSPTPGQMPSCHVCGTIMVGLCPQCEASTGVVDVTPGQQVTAATEEEAREFLCEWGVQNRKLNYYTPEKCDLPLAAQPTAVDIMVAFANRASAPPAPAEGKENRCRKFRKKPVVIEAVQYEPLDDVTEPDIRRKYGKFLGVELVDVQLAHTNHPVTGNVYWFIIIPTLEGDMLCSPGDWIIRGVAGEFYPCKPHIFAATYDPVEAGAGKEKGV